MFAVFTGLEALFNILTATTITYTKYYYIYTGYFAHYLSYTDM